MTLFHAIVKALAGAPPQVVSQTPAWILPLFGLLGVLATAGVTWLIAKRKSSGSIGTTEADTLWQQAQAMRQELRDQVDDLVAKAEAAKLRIDELMAANEAKDEEIDKARTEMRRCHREMLHLREELSESQESIEVLRKAVRRLQRHSEDTASDVGIIRKEMAVTKSLAASQRTRREAKS